MEINCNGRQIEYRIMRKKMKNIRVHVKTDGIIYISAPHDVSESYIRRFLLEHSAELTEMVDKATAQRNALLDHSDGSQHHFLGDLITLHWVSKPCKPTLKSGVLSLFARNEQEAYTAYRQWLISECTALYTHINREVFEAFHKAGYAVPLARVQIKEMTSRWGSCTPSTGRISINFRLMQYPIGCIYGTLFHEYTHFLHQNHSDAFYAVLTSVYPEYKKWDAVLKKPLT